MLLLLLTESKTQLKELSILAWLANFLGQTLQRSALNGRQVIGFDSLDRARSNQVCVVQRTNAGKTNENVCSILSVFTRDRQEDLKKYQEKLLVLNFRTR